LTTKQKAKGSHFEERIVADAHEAGLLARRQPGSGVFVDYPNDVIIEDILGEAKAGYSTGAKETLSFRIQIKWLENVSIHAKKVGMWMGVLFFRPNGCIRYWVVLEKDKFLELLKENKQMRDELDDLRVKLSSRFEK
jgi:hypothetical protein